MLRPAVKAVSVTVIFGVYRCRYRRWRVVRPRCTAPRPVLFLAPTADDGRRAPRASTAPLPKAPPDEPAATFDGLRRQGQASHRRRRQGRRRHHCCWCWIATPARRCPTGTAHRSPSPRWCKLFIADDLLLQESKGRRSCRPLTAARSTSCCRSSDDSAAENFWNRSGGSAIVTRVVARYGSVEHDASRSNGRWWTTPSSTAADLVRYYDMLLAGTGGLPPEQANIIMANLAQSTPTRTDPTGRYPQRFGIPEGFYAEPVAVKQGWMCCWIGADWIAPVHRRHRPGPTLRDGDRIDCSPQARPPRAITSPRPSKTMLQAADLIEQIGAALAVRCNACSCRHAAIFAWSPENNTAGTSSSRQLSGRV